MKAKQAKRIPGVVVYLDKELPIVFRTVIEAVLRQDGLERGHPEKSTMCSLLYCSPIPPYCRKLTVLGIWWVVMRGWSCDFLSGAFLQASGITLVAPM